MSSLCAVCSNPALGPTGDEESEILFITSEPTDDEMKYNRVMTGQSFHIFKRELMKVAHLDLLQTRIVPLWYHPKCKKDCLLVSLEQVEKELEGKRLVILLGSEAVEHFTGLSISNTNGLDVTSEVAPELVDGVDRKFFAICHPNMLFRSWGEFCFGLGELNSWLEENK